ncbi:MAG: amidohydrolase family protein [Acidobacteriota bacterium]|nr:amidohydrolase family protein [Acidobacteriota bacterium]
MKIDFHIHVLTRQMVDVSWYGGLFLKHNPDLFAEHGQFPLTPERVLSEMDSAGVDYGLILPNESTQIGIDIPNEFVLEFCQGQERLFPWVDANPRKPNNPVKRLGEFIKAGAKALKLYPTYQWFYPNDPMLNDIYALAQEAGLPVMIHTGSSIFPTSRIKYGDPIFLDDVAVDYPRLNIVLAHCGRGPWYDHAVTLARTRANVFLELSGIPPHRLLEYLPALPRLSHKTIFGSDWPSVPPLKQVVEGISSLRDFSTEELDKILGENAARLLDLENSVGN